MGVNIRGVNGEKEETRFKDWVLGYFSVYILRKWEYISKGDWEGIVCEVGKNKVSVGDWKLSKESVLMEKE